jgi:ABC-type spermidine/putrescine transport system permease subunit I
MSNLVKNTVVVNSPIAEKNRKKKLFNNILGLLMVLPSFLVLFVTVVIPIVIAVWESFLEDNTNTFTLRRYAYLFADKTARESTLFTLKVTVVSTLIVIVIAYVIGLYVRFGKGWIPKAMSALYMIPMFVPGVIAVYGIMVLYGKNGWMARILSSAGASSFPRIIFDYKGILISQLWGHIPFAAMVITSGLVAIPYSIIESAKDVGASNLRIFFSFILPLSLKTMLVAVTFIFMGIIGSFTAPYMLGPNHPQMLGVAMFQQFSNFMDQRQASAIAFFMFILTSAMGAFYIFNMVKEESAKD